MSPAARMSRRRWSPAGNNGTRYDDFQTSENTPVDNDNLNSGTARADEHFLTNAGEMLSGTNNFSQLQVNYI